MTGRGLYYRWGPNHAADPIVTRYRARSDQVPKSKEELDGVGVYEVALIQRRDTKIWALPGGMREIVKGKMESFMYTARREFEEEFLSMHLKRSQGDKNRNDKQDSSDVADTKQQQAVLDELWDPQNVQVVYQGYVDDSRATDNAWPETVAVWAHLNPQKPDLNVRAGDDAVNAEWVSLPISDHPKRHVHHTHALLLAEVWKRIKEGAGAGRKQLYKF